jgi:DNA topoisomerase-1
MEDNLDEIAQGQKEWVHVLKNFYIPFKENLDKKYKEIDKIEEKTEEICEKCGAPMVLKMSRYGKFLACSAFPKCKNIKPLKPEEETKTEKTEEICEKCGAPMVLKTGRYGKFLSCSRYPECKNIKPFTKTTNIKCPKCQKGEIVERRTKRGRTFYSCSQYPKCDFALWSKPTGEKCPKCGGLLVFGKNGTILCSNKKCDYKKEK